MNRPPFTADVRAVDGRVVLDLRGEINAFAEHALQTAYSAAEALDPQAIGLNFAAVRYMNSTGIALIVSLLARARQARRPLLVFGLSDHYREIFQITRLADFMQIYPDEASLLAEPGSPAVKVMIEGGNNDESECDHDRAENQ